MRRAEQALGDLLVLPVRRVRHAPLPSQCCELRHNITIYDAHVALADLLGVVLLTSDKRLIKAAGRAAPCTWCAEPLNTASSLSRQGRGRGREAGTKDLTSVRHPSGPAEIRHNRPGSRRITPQRHPPGPASPRGAPPINFGLQLEPIARGRESMLAMLASSLWRRLRQAWRVRQVSPARVCGRRPTCTPTKLQRSSCPLRAVR